MTAANKPEESKANTSANNNAQPILTPEQIESIIIPKYIEAIALGVDALQILTVEEQTQTAEGENGNPSSSNQKHNFLYNRNLPAIIGTKEFNDDDFCGLSPSLHMQGLIFTLSNINHRLLGLKENAEPIQSSEKMESSAKPAQDDVDDVFLYFVSSINALVFLIRR